MEWLWLQKVEINKKLEPENTWEKEMASNALEDKYTIALFITDVQETILISGDAGWIFKFPIAKHGHKFTGGLENRSSPIVPFVHIDEIVVDKNSSWWS